jgi:hypothetical protein
MRRSNPEVSRHHIVPLDLTDTVRPLNAQVGGRLGVRLS